QQLDLAILLLDSDADGVMDSFKLWADDIPTCYGIVPARGGIIVACAPHILFLADRDCDGLPEIRETLFTGFRTRVLERSINNPRWGTDNWIYFAAGGEGGTISGPKLDGEVRLPHSDFRIRSDGSAIEQVHGRAGTFGMTVNAMGDRFPGTGGIPAMYALPLPMRYLVRNPHVATPGTNQYAVNYNQGFRISEPHPWRVQRRQDPAWIKFYGDRETNSNYFSGGCSNEVYEDAMFPESFHGNVFYCEPSLNLIHRCVLQSDEGGYRGERAPEHQDSEFLASRDQWFRPMNLRSGPNGGMYIVDMYREIIEDYSAIPRFLQQQYGLERGREHGRIWRLSYEDQGGTDNSSLLPVFAKLSERALVKELESPTRWRRRTSRRLLIERGTIAAAELKSTLQEDDISPRACVEVLYALEGLGALTPGDLVDAFRRISPLVRVHALRLSENWLGEEGHAFLRDAVYKCQEDGDARVLIQLAMTLGEDSNLQAMNVLCNLGLGHSQTRWVNEAILSSSESRALSLLQMLTTRVSQRSTKQEAMLRLLEGLSQTIAAKADEQEISQLIVLLTNAEAGIRECCFGALGNGLGAQRELKLEPVAWIALRESITKVGESGLRANLLKLATRTTGFQEELKPVFKQAIENAINVKAGMATRLAAIKILEFAPAEYWRQSNLLSSQHPVSIQAASVQAIASSGEPENIELLVQAWEKSSPQLRKTIVAALLGHEAGCRRMLEKISDGQIRMEALSQEAKTQLLEHPNASVAELAKQVIVMRRAGSETKSRIDAYLKGMNGEADFDSGQKVYESQCAKCHSLERDNKRVAPFLGTILNKPDASVLVDILDPSQKIDPEYQNYIVLTKDGRTLSGLLTSESATSIVLSKDREKREVLLRRDIEAMKASETSFMPSGLGDQIDPSAMRDLLRFLRANLADGK
ncbi:MAG: PVC-type heme-binding CxxCH protein, partial [Planctomycetota bacterium]